MQKIVNPWFFLAAINGFISVALGAMGAHMLPVDISERALFLYNQGADYQLTHSLALMGVAILQSMAGKNRPNNKLLLWAGGSFVVGIVLFSGTLYWLGINGSGSLGDWHFLTPIGGSALLVGWLALTLASWKIVWAKPDGE
jgi:uncharacterized membrane protein YgdD (TMEM256/DUF423 family)